MTSPAMVLVPPSGSPSDVTLTDRRTRRRWSVQVAPFRLAVTPVTVALCAGAYRVLRGGGWFDEEWSCRAGVRRRSHPTARIDDIGLRLARSVPEG